MCLVDCNLLVLLFRLDYYLGLYYYLDSDMKHLSELQYTTQKNKENSIMNCSFHNDPIVESITPCDSEMSIPFSVTFSFFSLVGNIFI